ncbi:hypothetical protein TNCV_246911 [Trichonephila clavipes]|nr:hypothetical protein TNCV_246911 [Trichonephila clavipes]
MFHRFRKTKYTIPAAALRASGPSSPSLPVRYWCVEKEIKNYVIITKVKIGHCYNCSLHATWLLATLVVAQRWKTGARAGVGWRQKTDVICRCARRFATASINKRYVTVVSIEQHQASETLKLLFDLVRYLKKKNSGARKNRYDDEKYHIIRFRVLLALSCDGRFSAEDV